MANPFAPASINFSALANLPNMYQQGVENNRERQMRDAFSQGMPTGPNGEVDVNRMWQMLAPHDPAGAAKHFAGRQMTPYQSQSLDLKREELDRTAPPAPTVRTMYDKEGRAQPSQWDGSKWVPVGGAKAPTGAVGGSAMQQGGKQVLGMVDQLTQKIINPKTDKPVPMFEQATGPFAGAAAEKDIWRPERLIYEATQGREAKAYLDQIKQDAQAINTVMQRALLKGGGQITENERAEINKILGAITTARSAQDALAQVENFKGLVGKIFGLDGSSPLASGTATETGDQWEAGQTYETPRGPATYLGDGQWEMPD